MLALDSQTLSITATCFQYHEYGRRAGLKIRSSQEGGGSSPTFGISGLRHIPQSSSQRQERYHPVLMFTTPCVAAVLLELHLSHGNAPLFESWPRAWATWPVDGGGWQAWYRPNSCYAGDRYGVPPESVWCPRTPGDRYGVPEPPEIGMVSPKPWRRNCPGQQSCSSTNPSGKRRWLCGDCGARRPDLFEIVGALNSPRGASRARPAPRAGAARSNPG